MLKAKRALLKNRGGLGESTDGQPALKEQEEEEAPSVTLSSVGAAPISEVLKKLKFKKLPDTGRS